MSRAPTRLGCPSASPFLAGNLGWMTASAGMLYIDAPVRLCVNYLQDDQRQTGIALVLLALALGTVGLRRVMSRAATSAASSASAERLGSSLR